jgi:hypothetical protein
VMWIIFIYIFNFYKFISLDVFMMNVRDTPHQVVFPHHAKYLKRNANLITVKIKEQENVRMDALRLEVKYDFLFLNFIFWLTIFFFLFSVLTMNVQHFYHQIVQLMLMDAKL